MNFEPFIIKKNYIGNKPWHYNLTKYISKKYPDINWTAKKHDWHYMLMLGERNNVVRLVMKIMYDLVFLVLGTTRCFKNFRWDGIGLVIILYIILLISSPYYLWINRDVTLDLN